MGLNRRQTGDEVDWLKIASATGALTGALQRSDKQQEYKKGVAEEEQVSQAQEKAQTAMQLGVSPEDARTQVSEQTRYQEPGFMGKILGEEGKYERSFTPEVAESGFQKAISSEMESSKALINKQTQDYSKKYAVISPDQMQNLDTTKEKNPQAATKAKALYFIAHGQTDAARGVANENLRKTREGLYNNFSSAIRTAKGLLKDPTTTNNNRGVQLMVDATNKMNNTAYQAEKVTVGGKPMVKTFIMYDGEKKEGDVYTPQEYLKELSGVTQQKYYQAFDADKAMSLDMNRKSLENPDWMINDKGVMVQVQTLRNPLTSDHHNMVYTKGGGMYPIQNRQELLKQGFRNYVKPKTTKGGTSKKLTNNIKVLKEAMELVKQSGRYSVDPDSGIVTEVATGNEVGPELIREAIALMPRLGVAFETGDVEELLKYLDVPEEGDIAGELLNTRKPTPQPALNRGNTVTPLTNPELLESPFG